MTGGGRWWQVVTGGDRWWQVMAGAALAVTSGWMQRFFLLLSMMPTRGSASPSAAQKAVSCRSSSITFSISGMVLESQAGEGGCGGGQVPGAVDQLGDLGGVGLGGR